MNSLLKYLHDQIPLTRSLGLEIISIDEQGARIRAPLAPNHNHLGSAFGGSLSTMMILSGYIWLYDALLKNGQSGHVLLFKEEAEYLLPVRSDIEVHTLPVASGDWEKFQTSFQRKGMGRIIIHAEISLPEGVAAKFKGEFVAQRT